VHKAVVRDLDALRREVKEREALHLAEIKDKETQELRKKVKTVHTWGGTAGTLIMSLVATKFGLDRKKLMNGSSNTVHTDA